MRGAIAGLLPWLAALAVIAAVPLAATVPAAAHEKRNVGPYEVEVGWDVEPAYAGLPNAVLVDVVDPRTSPPRGVDGLAATLRVEVRSGGLTKGLALGLDGSEGSPGVYVARFVPTRAGDYTFRLTGKIENTSVDETFESGPSTFDTVREAAAVEYPDRVPAGGDLAARLDAIDRDLGTVRAIAIAAIVLALLVPLGIARIRSRTRG